MNAILQRIAREFGTPCYVYFMEQVRQRVADVRATFGDRLGISFAVKSNPNPGILRWMKQVADALDVSSAGEISRAVEAGWEASRLSFTGPGKTAAELHMAVATGIGAVVLESVDEARLLDEAAGRAGKEQRVLVRISPARVPRGFGLSMSGKPSQFGVDEEDIDAAVEAVKALPHLDLCGLHIFSGTQCLKAAAIIENYGIYLDIFRRVCRAHALAPRELIFGAGIGIPYYEQDEPVDLAAVAAQINPAIDALKQEPAFSRTALLLESGRYLIGEAGIYMTRVLRKKRSRGADICVCDGGMNHHLGAAGLLGSLLPRNYKMFKITVERAEEPEQPYNLVGPLCTTIDTLGRQVEFKGLDAGDLIGIRGSGAYGLSASPLHFISHCPPKEIIVEGTPGAASIRDSSQFQAAATGAAGRETSSGN